MRGSELEPFAPKFFQQSVEDVAQGLLGSLLVREFDDQQLIVRVVETEAYLGIEDRAAHSFGGRRTARNEVMYGPAGRAYVYLIYGLHHCVNVVVGAEQVPTAVLIRAAEPCLGQEEMRERRRLTRVEKPGDLCGGPGKLCQALAIDRSHNGADLSHGALRLVPGPPPQAEVVSAPRVGIDYAGEAVDWPLRFALAGNPHVSRPRL